MPNRSINFGFELVHVGNRIAISTSVSKVQILLKKLGLQQRWSPIYLDIRNPLCGQDIRNPLYLERNIRNPLYLKIGYKKPFVPREKYRKPCVSLERNI